MSINFYRMVANKGADMGVISQFVTTNSSPAFDITSINGTTLTVGWGDGTNTENFAMTGSKVDVDRNYGSGGTRTITFSGTGNTAMFKLIGVNNSLTSLDINENTALTILSCGQNSLTVLDISENIALISLICELNSLPSTEINAHLAQLVANGLSNGNYAGASQTPSAPPTGQGITDKATLISRGWTVLTD